MSTMSKEWRGPLCVSSSVDHSLCICIVLFYLVQYNVQYIILPCWQRTLYLYCIVVFCITYNTKSSTTAVTTQNCPPSTYGTFACKIPPPSSFCCSKCSPLYLDVFLHGISFSINFFSPIQSIIWCHKTKQQGMNSGSGKIFDLKTFFLSSISCEQLLLCIHVFLHNYLTFFETRRAIWCSPARWRCQCHQMASTLWSMV